MHRRLLARPGKATCSQLLLILNDLLLQRCDEHENEIEHITHIPSRSDCQVLLYICKFFIFLKNLDSIKQRRTDQNESKLNIFRLFVKTTKDVNSSAMRWM